MTPSWDQLDEYHSQKNTGKSVTSLWHASSVGAVCPTGHNSDTSQARFGGGEHYFGDVELSVPPEGRDARALSPSLDPHGMEVYILDEATSDDSEVLFLSDSERSKG